MKEIIFLLFLSISLTCWAQDDYVTSWGEENGKENISLDRPASSIPATSERKIDKVYNTDGTVFSETNLFSDRNNGFYRTFHRNGKLATEIRYKDGLQIYDKAFDDQGQPLIRNGIVRTFYANGQTASMGQYRNDLKNGKEEFYYYDGTTVVDIWHFMNGRKVGLHTRNDAQGHFISEEDLGYPTYYVRKLEKIIWKLSVLVALLIIGWVFSVRKKYRG